VKPTTIIAPALTTALSLGAMSAASEIVLLKSGERREGEIVIYHNRGVLLRESQGSPGRYYPFDEIRRVATADGMLWYLMPRSSRPPEERRFGDFPLTRLLTPIRKTVAPTPCLVPPQGESVEVACEDAEDPVPIRRRGGAKIRLLGLDPPPECAGKGMERKAKAYLSSRVRGKDALLYPGPQGGDSEGIPEAYVVVDRGFVNAGVIEHGWAIAAAAPPAHPYREAFLALQKFAMTLQRGIWSAARP